MKKSMLVGLILLTSICLFAAVNNVYVIKVKVQVANVRSEPDLKAQVIGQVKMGDLFETLNEMESFYEITITDNKGNATTGFIHSGVVEVISGEEAKEESEPAVQEERERIPLKRSQYRSLPTEARSTRLILRAGMAMSNVTLSEPIPSGLSKSSATGFGVSLGYEFGGPNFCLEIDAIYVPGGFKISGTAQDTPVKVSVAGRGIGASVLAKFKLMQRSTPYVFGGAEAGYLLSQKTVVSAGEQKETSTDLEGVNRIAYGLDFGAGYEFNLEGLVLLIEAKYYLGLSNMIKEPEEGAYIKPNGLTIGFGIKL